MLLLSGGQWSNRRHLSRSWYDAGFLCQYANFYLHRSHGHAPFLWVFPFPAPPAYPHLHDARSPLRKQRSHEDVFHLEHEFTRIIVVQPDGHHFKMTAVEVSNQVNSDLFWLNITLQ